MNALRILAPLALCFAVAHSLDCADLEYDRSDDSYQAECAVTDGCEWNSSDELCASTDGANEKSCCISSPTPNPTPQPTPSPSKNPTPAPTDAPTCPTLGGRTVCGHLSQDCCLEESEDCVFDTAEDECVDVTTTTTTTSTTTTTTTTETPTPSPTEKPTPAPTTTESPTPSPVLPTPAPTTTTETPTPGPSRNPTPEPTPSPVTITPAPTTSTTEDADIPTPNPTLPSAQKWEMLHPNYKGNDGELMWQVYYGDYADDERFDDFRKEEMWDAEVIRPIIAEDAKFARYQAVAVSAHSAKVSAIAQYQAWFWALFASVAVIGALLFACRSRNGGYKKVAEAETDSLLKDTRNNSVYSN